MPLPQPSSAVVPFRRNQLASGVGAAALSAGMPRGGRAAAAREVPAADSSDEEFEFRSVADLRKDYLDYLSSKVDEVEEQKESRRYYHGAQLTSDQIRVLRDRHQPPMVWNRTGRKINGIVGLIERMRSDPKALPRTPKHEDGAEVATQAIRYVLDANEWKARDPQCLLQCGIDGIAGIELELIEGDHGDHDVKFNKVLGDEYFYNPQSVEADFSDNFYEGVAKWIDIDAAIDLFPDKEQELRDLTESGSDLTTSADREHRWISANRKRIRLVRQCYRHRGEWCWADYVSTVLLDEGVSPFKDEKGKTMSRFIMFSAAVDHDGDRYGFVRNLKGPQDSLNQSKSKTLHIANAFQLIVEKGAVDDVEVLRRERARPDGVIEVNQGRVEGIKDVAKDTQLAAFLKFAEDAINEIEKNGNTNIADLNGSALGNISGRAIELLRQPGLAELGPFIFAYRGWKLRVYRAIWNIIQQYWTAERYIRVTDNDGLAQFLKLNGLELDQWGRPMIVNHVGSLDVDIILEEGPDIGNLMQDTYELMKTQPPGTFPPAMLIEASQIPRSEKDRLIKMQQPPPQQADPMAEMAKKATLDGLIAQAAALNADAAKKHAEGIKTLASVEQVEAAAMETRSRIPLNAAKAARDATGAHLDASRFALDVLGQAHDQKTENAERGASSGTAVPIPHPVPAAPPQAYPPPF